MIGQSPSLSRRILRIPAQIVVGLYVVVDGIVAPLFRPFMRWLSSLRLVQTMERGVESLPPYVILVLLVVPFAIAELAKAYAVFLIGSGHFKTGLFIFVMAYIVSILVCERIFSAGKTKLMTIDWFARLFQWVMGYKDRMLAWFRTNEVWRLAGDLKQKARIAARRVKTRLGFTG